MVLELTFEYYIKYNPDNNQVLFALKGKWDDEDTTEVMNEWHKTMNKIDGSTKIMIDWSKFHVPDAKIGELITDMLSMTGNRVDRIAGVLPENNDLLSQAVNRFVRDAEIITHYEQFYNREIAKEWLNSKVEPTSTLIPKGEEYVSGEIETTELADNNLLEQKSLSQNVPDNAADQNPSSTDSSIPSSIETAFKKTSTKAQDEIIGDPNLRDNPVVNKYKNEVQEIPEKEAEDYKEDTDEYRELTSKERREPED